MINPLSKKSREIGKKVTLLIEGSPSANKTDLHLQCLLLNKYTLSRVKYFITVTITKVYCKLVSVCVHPTAKVKKMLKLAQRNAQDTSEKVFIKSWYKLLTIFCHLIFCYTRRTARRTNFHFHFTFLYCRRHVI